jgi:hypothetical protein
MTYNERRGNIMEEVHAFYAVVLFGYTRHINPIPPISLPALFLMVRFVYFCKQGGREWSQTRRQTTRVVFFIFYSLHYNEDYPHGKIIILSMDNGHPTHPLAFASCAEILEQSMGARNREGIGLSYRPARLHTGKDCQNRFLGIDSPGYLKV